MRIDEFMGEYRWLSNFVGKITNSNGETYPTVEHAYQSAKSFDPIDKYIIHSAKTPKEARKLGQTIELRPDWENVKLEIMYRLVRAKFTQNKWLASLLIATGDADLIEGNYWNDTYWGVCDGVGENYLGKILMAVRRGLTKPPWRIRCDK